MVQFQTKDWLSQHRQQSKGIGKRALFYFLRPGLSAFYSRYVSQETLQKYQPRFCLGSRGMPLETRRWWARKPVPDFHQATVLVQGTGTGWDVISWARLRPARVIGLDLFSFQDSWEQVEKYCYDQYKVQVEFHTASLEDLTFIDRDSIDLIASDAVYEHCRDLLRVMQESFRVLRPGGFLYASYGPLYFCAGGDHFSGRGGLETAYNHLWLDADSYRGYVERHTEVVEDFQTGVKYIELGLFSYLTSSQYFDIFKDTGFEIKDLILEVSDDAVKFRKSFPQKFELVRQKNLERCWVDDLLIKAHLIILRKPSA